MKRLLIIGLALAAVGAQAQDLESELASEIMAAVSRVALEANAAIPPKPCARGLEPSLASTFDGLLCSRFLLSLPVMQEAIAAAVRDHAERHPRPPAYLMTWERSRAVVDSVVRRGASFVFVLIIDISPRSLLIAWKPAR